MKKILIVEDDPALQRMYSNTLKLSNFDVTASSNAAMAFTELAKAKFDLIILDIMLPGGKNGFDIMEELKSDPATSQIPIIICTNLDSEKETAMKIGATDYFIKSDSPVSELTDKVNKILEV
jgi:two-component system, OmpR family, phosphate regulon response regulator PhoB